VHLGRVRGIADHGLGTVGPGKNLLEMSEAFGRVAR
jgi:hypothetical protein